MTSSQNFLTASNHFYYLGHFKDNLKKDNEVMNSGAKNVQWLRFSFNSEASSHFPTSIIHVPKSAKKHHRPLNRTRNTNRQLAIKHLFYDILCFLLQAKSFYDLVIKAAQKFFLPIFLYIISFNRMLKTLKRYTVNATNGTQNSECDCKEPSKDSNLPRIACTMLSTCFN